MPLPFVQSEVLRLLGETPEPCMHDVATYFRVTPPTATTLVAHLVKEGYVERVADARDRRQIRLRLTKSGTRMYATIARVRDEAITGMLRSLRAKDVATLSTLLGKIITHASEK